MRSFLIAGLSLFISYIPLQAALADGGNENAHQEHLPEDEPMPVYEKAIINDKGEEIGKLHLQETHKGVLVFIDAKGLSEGGDNYSEHAMHFHETGDCSPLKDEVEGKGAFINTGGHYNLFGSDHGFKHHHGAHEGDMPNIFVHKDGSAKVKLLNTFVTLKDNTYMNRAPLFDADGSALIIHAGEDDYKSQPSGAAGPRIACAVIKASDEKKAKMNEAASKAHKAHGHDMKDHMKDMKAPDYLKVPMSIE